MRCVVLPVVIGDKQRSIAVAQLQGWIGQRIGHSERTETGTQPADYNAVVVAAVPQREARDHDVASRPAEGARANIAQCRQSGLIKVVDFHQGHSRGATIAAHNRGIRSRCQRRKDR